MDTAGLSGFDSDSWSLAVQPNSGRLELVGELFFLFEPLLGIEHHDDQVGGFADSDDLTSLTTAGGSTFDNSGQIEQLDFSPIDP